MGIADIIFIVEMETGCSLTQMISATTGTAYDAKCIAAMMAHEEGVKDKGPLAKLMNVERSTIYNYINRTDKLLSIWPRMYGYNKVFKLLYLACNGRRSYIEERPELLLTYKEESI